MLQQTQVDRVLPKYAEWLEKFPSLGALAAAPEHDVTHTWRPLGYNIRPKRLQSIAREAVERYDGKLPADEETLLSFKGIGAYTAGAIRSFAFRERAAILDTNVARVLYRVFDGGATTIRRGSGTGSTAVRRSSDRRAALERAALKSHAVKKRLWALSEAVLPHKHVFDFNQALMDLGATVCTARKPKCAACPLARQCRTYPRLVG